MNQKSKEPTYRFRRVAKRGAYFLAALFALPLPVFVSPAAMGAEDQTATTVENFTKPALRDFIGLNVHTVQFKPELYKPIAKLLRDYHGFNWDVGDESNFYPAFPFARNRVSWEKLYGDWTKADYKVNVTVMFDDTPPAKWVDLPRDAWAYGFAFARAFGPSSRLNVVESVEIGNEPGDYPDAEYRTLFENAAKGMRQGDPKLLIATCATDTKESGKYHKSLETVKGLEPLYDVINLHSYPQREGWPTWRRSYPEDPKLDFLKTIQQVIDWRNTHAPGKQVWLTEFGWDSTTKPQAKEGAFAKWVGVTDEQQAQYLARALMVLAEMDLDRAYIYWFNDEDKPQLHAASGLTRNYQPKPSFHAVAHLQSTLGHYRFARALKKEENAVYLYEFTIVAKHSPPAKRIWAVWSPTGNNRVAKIRLPIAAERIEQAERMPLQAGAAAKVSYRAAGPNEVELDIGESPIYLWLKK